MSDYLDPANEELLKDFFMEAHAQIEILERNILVIENDPSDKESVDEIFRAAHTLKGNSGAVEMFEIAEFTHHMEDVLDEIRADKIVIDGEVVDILLESIDVVKAMIQSRVEGVPYDGDYTAIGESLKSLMTASAAAKKTTKKSTTVATVVAISESLADINKLTEQEIEELYDAVDSNETIYDVEVSFDADSPMNTIGGIQIFAKLKDYSTVLMTKPDFDSLYDDNYFPIVDYFVVSDHAPEEIIKHITLTDVTTGSKISVMPNKGEIHKIASSSVSATPTVNVEVVEENSAQVADVLAEKQKKVADSGVGIVGDEIEKPLKDKKVVTSDSTILKVDSKRIDNLLNLVSETVINKATFNQIGVKFLSIHEELNNKSRKMNESIERIYEKLLRYVRADVDVKSLKSEIFSAYDSAKVWESNIVSSLENTITKFIDTTHNFGNITNELHENVLQIRMVPIAQIFSRFPRLVRDVSKKLGKQIKLIIEGEDTELDKSVIEQLLDPLIHCIRNSMDHGIELPLARAEKGKNPEGIIILRAKNEGNIILIEICDDGNGIDVDVIKAKAVSKGILHSSKNLTDVEAFNLIFDAGFSTAKEVTDISGRGVGLDVVRRQIEKLNGSVNVWSQKGMGSTFTIKLPLTLAIIQGLLVRVGEELYAIPINSVIESQRIFSSDIKLIDNYEVVEIREDIVSIIRLCRLFGIEKHEDSDRQYLVVVGNNDKKIGLMVDQLIGEEDVVIKAMKDKYTNVPGVAGATILGDGQVSLILDVNQIIDLCFKRERMVREKRDMVF